MHTLTPTLLEEMTEFLCDHELAAVRLTAQLRLFPEATWTQPFALEFRHTGSLLVDGHAVDAEVAQSWCAYVLAERRRDPKGMSRALERIPLPSPTLDKAEARTLHQTLGRLGIKNHDSFASDHLKRTIESLTEVTRREARLLERRAELAWGL